MPEQSRSLPVLLRGARALDVALDPAQIDAFASFAELLLTWNARINLTAITEPTEIQVKHFIDSLTAVPVLRERLGRGGGELIDVGAGAGLPGLALAIAMPELAVTLVEATAKKVEFMHCAIEVLELANARAVHGRAEDLARLPEHRERYDVAIARAVGSAATLVELLAPFVRDGGWAVLMKKRSGLDSEIREAAFALNRLACEVEAIADADVPGLLEDRALVVIRKRGPTSPAFPRRAGVPERRPLRA